MKPALLRKTTEKVTRRSGPRLPTLPLLRLSTLCAERTSGNHKQHQPTRLKADAPNSGAQHARKHPQRHRMHSVHGQAPLVIPESRWPVTYAHTSEPVPTGGEGLAAMARMLHKPTHLTQKHRNRDHEGSAGALVPRS
jgi:hypothetical protein